MSDPVLSPMVAGVSVSDPVLRPAVAWRVRE